jgi:hypothetical protein
VHDTPRVPAPTTVVAPQPDLSPVREPPGLIALAHIRNAGASLDALGRMARLPMSLRNLVEDQLASAGRDMIKIDSSADAVFVLDLSSTDDDPKILAAFALPVLSLEAALASLERDGKEMIPVAPGVFRGAVLSAPTASTPPAPGNDEPTSSGEPMQCDLAVSVGDAPARLVCADTTAELDLLRPWLTRGMPVASYGTADAHAEVRFEPVQSRYAPVLRSQADRWSAQATQWLEAEALIREPILLQAPGSVLQEGVRLVDDLDMVTMDLELDPAARQVTAKGRLRFKGRSSWFTQLLTDANDKADAPPPLFWRAPRDSDSVTFARGVDPARFEGIRRVLLAAATTLLPRTSLPASSRSAIERYIQSYPLRQADVVTAQGSLPAAAPKKAAGPHKPSDAVAAAKAMANEFGWLVVGVDRPAAEYAALLRDTASLCNRLLQDAKADKSLGLDADWKKWTPTIQLVEHPQGYPKGSVALDFSVRFDSRMVWDITRALLDAELAPHPDGPAAKGSITLRVVVVPDGPSRTWTGMSTDLSALQSHIRMVLGSAPDSGTIAALQSLAPLRSEPVTSVGVLVYGRILKRRLDDPRISVPEYGDFLDPVLDTLPNRFMTPWVVIGRGTAGAAPTNEVELRILPGTIDDLASLAAFAMTDKGRAWFDSLDRPKP